VDRQGRVTKELGDTFGETIQEAEDASDTDDEHEKLKKDFQ